MKASFPLILPPALVSLAMLLAGFATCQLAHVDFVDLFNPYFGTSLAITFVSVLVSVFCWVLRLALVGADDPVGKIITRLRCRLPLLILPAVVFPLFLIAFTMTKTAVPFLVGYRWDGFWANADHWIFGEDAWRIAHDVFGTQSAVIWQWVYTMGWGSALIFIPALVTLNASPRRAAIYFTAFFGTWFVGGFCMAYAMSAAGPIFTQVTDPELAARFVGLHSTLNQSLAAGGPIRSTQAYLSHALDMHTAVKGGGISAFPSMHLATASIYVLSARRTRFILPAIMFWAVIFICSAYFGYHYWIDGIVAAGVAYACWTVSEHYFQKPEMSAESTGYPLGVTASS